MIKYLTNIFLLLFRIVLESAYSLHDRTFYENIGTTLIYAVVVSTSLYRLKCEK